MLNRVIALLTTALLLSAVLFGHFQPSSASPVPSPRPTSRRAVEEREIEARAIAEFTNARRLAEGLPLIPPARRATRTNYARQNVRGGKPSPIPPVPNHRRSPED